MSLEITVPRPLKVLIAEDDSLLADYLTAAIAGLVGEIQVVTDGQAALDLMRETKFDVLITDWVMPNMDGIELVKQARALSEGYLHIMMMTARSEARTVKKALEAGADDLISKPFDLSEIELGIATATRVVELERRLMRQNRHLSAAHRRTRTAYHKLRTDLTAAAKVQQQLLPSPRLEGSVRYSWSFKPSLQLGGDSLDVVPLPNGNFLFFNIDVSGHGVPAALNSFSLHHRLNLFAPREASELEAFVRRLNEETLDQAGENYLTMVLGLIEEDGRRLSYIRAGHPMPLRLPAEGEAEFIEDGSVPVGLLPQANYELTRLELAAGDRVLFYSDGVTDCDDHSCFSEAGLAELVTSKRHLPTPELVTAVETALSDLRGGRAPNDDISMLLIERAIDTKESR